MQHSQQLLQALAAGTRRIGEIQIKSTASIDRFQLMHYLDDGLSAEPGYGGLVSHYGAAEARLISLYAEDGSYRFLKAQSNLRRGWVLFVDSATELLQALDLFYPAAIGLWLAQQNGTLEVEALRPKLDRQTGMYRRARALDDATAQALIATTCGGDPPCARRILWQIDATTPLADSATSRQTGVIGDLAPAEAIPLLCREACNHFIAECLAAAKKMQPPSGESH